MSNSIGRGYGYSRAYGKLAHELAKKGYDVIYFGMQDNCPPWRDENGILRLGVRYAPYGGDILGYYLRSYKPDVFISGVDLWMDDIEYIPQIVHKRRIPWIAGVTVNSEPLSHMLFRTIRHATVLVSPSRFGVEVMAREGLNSLHIPHGLDLDVFKPKHEPVFDLFKLAKPKHVALSVQRNKGFQKGIPILFDAWQKLVMEHTEYASDAVLLMLTDPQEPEGFETLLELRKRLGLEDQIQFLWARPDENGELIPTFEGDARGMPHNANIGFSEEVMSCLYNIAGVHVLSSMCESFNLPTAEALACGTPCIAPNHSALPELITGGEPTPRGLLVDIAAKFILPTISELNMASTEHMAESIHTMFSDKRLHKRCSKRGVGFTKRFGWNKIVPQWEKLINDVYEGFYFNSNYNEGILGV